MSGKIPDIAMVDDRDLLLVVGEVKTPWMHDLKNTMLEDEVEFRNYLGQISRYMYYSKRKFGFLTTYSQTIFLKQAPDPEHPKTMALWYSSVIKNDDVDPVTLRECFLFLGMEVKDGGGYCKNETEEKEWVGSPGGKNYTDADHYSPDDDSIEGEGRVTLGGDLPHGHSHEPDRIPDLNIHTSKLHHGQQKAGDPEGLGGMSKKYAKYQIAPGILI
ncbi:hypothetical protein N7528_007277 [Penicillium herquei]|nr:hypothetical protein N7528_007277 [Penicillium herquei]